MDRPPPTRIPGPGVLARPAERDVVLAAFFILAVAMGLFLVGVQILAWIE